MSNFQITRFCTLLLWHTVVLKNNSCILRTTHALTLLWSRTCIMPHAKTSFLLKRLYIPIALPSRKARRRTCCFQNRYKGLWLPYQEKALVTRLVFSMSELLSTSHIAGSINSAWNHQNHCWTVEKKYLCLPLNHVQMNIEHSTVYFNLLCIYHTALL